MASVPSVATAPRLLPTARALVEGTRPRQWVKNAFVLAGVVFAGLVTDATAVASALLATAAFCLVSGAAYLFNDVCDAAVDRTDPRTAERPLARGALSVRASIAGAATAAALGLALALAVNSGTALLAAGFLLLQVAYSLVLKRLRFVDVGAIAAGFVVRAAAGAAAVGAALSVWLLVCTALLTLFLAFAKRRSEIVATRDVGSRGRAVLAVYSLAALDRVLAALAVVTLGVYAAYSVLGPASTAMVVTVPLVGIGLVRAWRTTRAGGDPSSVWSGDRLLVVCVAGWAALAGVIALQSA